MQKYAKPPKLSLGKVTALKRQIKNPERVSIFVDEKYSFSLSLSELLEQKLKVGLVLEQADILRLKKLSSDGKLRFKALNWATLRPRSIKELKDYLKRTTYKRSISAKNKEPAQSVAVEAPADLIETIVHDFETKGYVSDQRFAEWWVARRSSQKKSQVTLRQELSQKGISKDIQSEVLLGSDDEALRALILKVRSRSKYTDREKLIRYCMSKGFRYSLIVEALAALDDNPG